MTTPLLMEQAHRGDCRLKPIPPKKVVHLLSGGLDSTVLLYDLLRQQCDVHCVLFDYRQRHAARELRWARWHCDFKGVKFTEMSVPPIRGSLLTDGRGTKVVPNRNAILLSVAVSLAVNAGAEAVTFACNKDDAADFPDCRIEFVKAMSAAARAAGTMVEVCAPYVNLSKREIVHMGRTLGVHLESTYSCYLGEEVPCGACDACLKRSEAMA